MAMSAGGTSTRFRPFRLPPYVKASAPCLPGSACSAAAGTSRIRIDALYLGGTRRAMASSPARTRVGANARGPRAAFLKGIYSRPDSVNACARHDLFPKPWFPVANLRQYVMPFLLAGAGITSGIVTLPYPPARREIFRETVIRVLLDVQFSYNRDHRHGRRRHELQGRMSASTTSFCSTRRHHETPP